MAAEFACLRLTHALPNALEAETGCIVHSRYIPMMEILDRSDLARALADPDPFVRVVALTKAGATEGTEELVASSLSDEYPLVRREAVRALSRIGTSATARALIATAGQDPAAEVREEAVAALAGLLHNEARAAVRT